MMEKKKFEIPIPEITTVADLKGDSVVGLLGGVAGIKEESKLIIDDLSSTLNLNKIDLNSAK